MSQRTITVPPLVAAQAAVNAIRATTKKIAGATLRSTSTRWSWRMRSGRCSTPLIPARVAPGSFDDVPIAAAVWRAAELACEPWHRGLAGMLTGCLRAIVVRGIECGELPQGTDVELLA